MMKALNDWEMKDCQRWAEGQLSVPVALGGRKVTGRAKSPPCCWTSSPTDPFGIVWIAAASCLGEAVVLFLPILPLSLVQKPL